MGALPTIRFMREYRLRLAQLALENMPFPLHQARVVLDLHAADGASTQALQYRMPYSSVLGVGSETPAASVGRCGERYLRELPPKFRCDCVVALLEPHQPLTPTLEVIDSLETRWAVVVAPYSTAQSVEWSHRGYQTHYEITEEPNDGVIVLGLRDSEAQAILTATPRVLVISPVRQKPAILAHFLEGLRRLDTTGMEVGFLFIDNNDEPRSSNMLLEFTRQVSVPVHRIRLPVGEPYHRTESHHCWTESLYWRLAAIKDGALEVAQRQGYDYAFLVDSDLVLHPQTLQRMVACRREVLSQVFWTAWSDDKPPLPNVWYGDSYNLYRVRRHQSLEREQQARRTEAFLSALAFYPGVYRVGGLGACTLIARRAIEAGVSFGELRGLIQQGEDRHFCARAESLGLRLFADTTLPALHLYRESELPRVEKYWRLVEAGLQGVELNREMFHLLLGKQLSVA
ncbi:MAG: glycosyltransferase family 2 protein [Fimbriimonadales bacterium]